MSIKKKNLRLSFYFHWTRYSRSRIYPVVNAVDDNPVLFSAGLYSNQSRIQSKRKIVSKYLKHTSSTLFRRSSSFFAGFAIWFDFGTFFGLDALSNEPKAASKLVKPSSSSECFSIFAFFDFVFEFNFSSWGRFNDSDEELEAGGSFWFTVISLWFEFLLECLSFFTFFDSTRPFLGTASVVSSNSMPFCWAFS